MPKRSWKISCSWRKLHPVSVLRSREKCEVVGHTGAARSLFAANNVTPPDISPSSVDLLGAPLSVGPHLDSMLEERREELLCCQRDYNSCKPTTVCFYCAMFLQHLGLCTCCDLRCVSLVRCCRFMTQCFVSLSATLNMDLDDLIWSYVSLPIRWGGLGVAGWRLFLHSDLFS